MKKRLVLLMFAFSSISYAGTFNLEVFDQEKLADLLDRLSHHTKRVQRISSGNSTIEIRRTTFPVNESPLEMICDRKYFNRSEYASITSCTVALDIDDSKVSHRFDEYELQMEEDEAFSLFESISYGRPKKVLRSYGNDSGVSFEGIQTRIFHYQLTCSPEECLWKFSSKVHRQ